jgi:hypothetical protein
MKRWASVNATWSPKVSQALVLLGKGIVMAASLGSDTVTVKPTDCGSGAKEAANQGYSRSSTANFQELLQSYPTCFECAGATGSIPKDSLFLTWQLLPAVAGSQFFTVGSSCSLKNAQAAKKAREAAKKAQDAQMGYRTSSNKKQDPQVARINRWDSFSKQFGADEVKVLAQVLNNSAATALLLWELSQSGYKAQPKVNRYGTPLGGIEVSLWLEPIKGAADFLRKHTATALLLWEPPK